jgi:pyrimidine precursor biosynthesis enzyme
MTVENSLSFLFNWKALPYHAPVLIAKHLNYFKDENVNVMILEPTDPSDVTHLIGSGRVDMGFKAMIHTIAASTKYPVSSIGTLLDEPFTGVIYVSDEANNFEEWKDISILKGKRIGYVGHFGKLILDELMERNGFAPSDYEAIRVGMNVTQAIKDGTIDAGVGLENVQMVELEQTYKGVHMLRIDELADLGCCCFCSILYIANDNFIKAHPELVASFMKAVKRATNYIVKDPNGAYDLLCKISPEMDTKVNKEIYHRSLVYLSKDLLNVERDWNKVTNYCKHLKIIDQSFVQNYTNEFV